MALMSMRAYARHRAERGLPGTSHQAVRKAIDAGRISTVDGKIDPEVADREWAENSSEGHRRGPEPKRETPPKRAAPAEVNETPTRRDPSRRPARARPEEPEDEYPEDLPILSFADANAREKTWKARLAELDYRERSGELVHAGEMRAALVDVFTRCRTKLLGIPTRARQQLPHLTHSDIGLLDSLVREALEDLAETRVLEDEDESYQEAAHG